MERNNGLKLANLKKSNVQGKEAEWPRIEMSTKRPVRYRVLCLDPHSYTVGIWTPVTGQQQEQNHSSCRGSFALSVCVPSKFGC